MKALLRALSTSVGRKFVMGITGLLLCGFLVVHLGGNLLMYVGPQAYNDYAQALHRQEWLVKLAEVGLAVLFVVHILLAVQVSRDNRRARPVNYLRRESKLTTRLIDAGWAAPDTWMFVSGAIVLGFLVLHLADFTFELRSDVTYAGKYPYEKAVDVLRTPLSRSVYFVGTAILGAHLGHGVASAFKSLGLSHPKYDGLIQWAGVVFALVIAAGFASFPLLAEALPRTGRG